MDDVIWGFICPVGMTSEGGLIGKLPVAQRALVDVWEVCLCMEGAQDGIVRPEGTIDAEIAAG